MLHILEELQINHTFSFDEELDFLRDEIESENSSLDDKLKENENKTTKQSKTSNKKLSKRIPLEILNAKIFART